MGMTSLRKVESLRDQRNIRGLCSALRDQNPLIRRRAAQALGEVRDPAGVPCLARALREDTDQYVQQWTVDSLKAIGDETAIQALTAALFNGDRRIPALAAQALSALPSDMAAAALQVREAATRSDWSSLEQLGSSAQRALSALLGSPLYASWHPAKRREALNCAMRLGATMPSAQRRELAGIGLFVSGLHSIGDLLNGLRHRAPAVRIAAASRLGASGRAWTARPMWRRFQREIGMKEDRGSAIAIARAMGQLGDMRAIRYYQERLSHADSRIAAEAARSLVEVGTQQSLEILFWYIVRPLPAPANRNIPHVLSALQAGGSKVIDGLRHLLDHEMVKARRLMVELLTECQPPDVTVLLSDYARDADVEIQHSAVEALGQLNSEPATEVLYSLVDVVPNSWIIRALCVMTHPMAVARLRGLDPLATTFHGTILDNRLPIERARVQVVQEHYTRHEWIWRAISARAESDAEGRFALALFELEPDRTVRLKVVTAVQPNHQGGEIFVGDLPAVPGKDHQVQASIDRLFGRLNIDVTGLNREAPA